MPATIRAASATRAFMNCISSSVVLVHAIMAGESQAFSLFFAFTGVAAVSRDGTAIAWWAGDYFVWMGIPRKTIGSPGIEPEKGPFLVKV